MSDTQNGNDARIDLAARRLGGMVLAASDDFFAEKERLIAPEPAVFRPGVYQDHGKWMDGWETRRRRDYRDELDWAVLRLGVAGVVEAVDVDCSFFVGNAPETVAIDGLVSDGPLTEHEARDLPESAWRPIVARTAVTPGQHNLLEAVDAGRVTHVRLRVWPDGGVARLRVYGRGVPDWERLRARGGALDLAALEHGGTIAAVNDAFFSPPANMLLPGQSEEMGDGWETRRRRAATSGGATEDWCVVKLGAPGTVRWIRVETHHFKGNFPERCRLEGARAPDGGGVPVEELDWKPLVDDTRLAPHAAHDLDGDAIHDLGVITHVRLTIIPDGGISRLRVYATPAES